MVVGTGLIAKAFCHYKNNADYIIFASGVSNSLNSNKVEYEKERNLLQKTLVSKKPGQKLIYFSTFNVFDPSLEENDYVIHKKSIELFLGKFPDVIIVRLPVVIAKSTNPNTLINFFADKIKHQKEFIVYKESLRYIISLDDTIRLIDQILQKNSVPKKSYNISYPEAMAVDEMVQLIEQSLSTKARYKSLPLGSFYKVDGIFYQDAPGAVVFEGSKDYFLHHFKRSCKT